MTRMKDHTHIRPMTLSDIDATYLMAGIALSETPEEEARIQSRTPEEVQRRVNRYRHFLRHDPDGAWVAVDGDRVVGVAVALWRESVWVLSLFAVDEEYRGTGVGRDLIDRALQYSAGCDGAMIAASTHPAAMRRYARAGFDLRPTLMASGTVRQSALPENLPVRIGHEKDLPLVAEVDRSLRGAAHGPDIEHMLQNGAHLFVSENPAGRGYAVERQGSPALVAATHPAVAAELLWACLGRADGEVEVRWITAHQDWAVAVALEAGLVLTPAGPLCTRGALGPLTPYLPSGAFL